nr:hypothetical protein CFP56_30905 [Quercus suber]
MRDQAKRAVTKWQANGVGRVVTVVVGVGHMVVVGGETRRSESMSNVAGSGGNGCDCDRAGFACDRSLGPSPHPVPVPYANPSALRFACDGVELWGWHRDDYARRRTVCLSVDHQLLRCLSRHISEERVSR